MRGPDISWTALLPQILPSFLQGSVPESRSVQVDLTHHFNHKAFGSYPGETAFGLQNRSYPVLDSLAPNGIYTSRRTGIKYSFPGYSGVGVPDNVICNNQTIRVPRRQGGGTAFSVSMLLANDLQDTTISRNVTYVYADDTTSQAELRAMPFSTYLLLAHGEIVSKFTWTASGRDGNASQIFEFTGAVDPNRDLDAVVLPDAADEEQGQIHVFALSLWRGEPGLGSGGPIVEVQAVRPTQKWTENGNQVVEVTVNNVGKRCLAGRGLRVSLEGYGVATAEYGKITRLCPGDQKRVDVGVVGRGSGTLTVTLDSELETREAEFSDVTIGFETFSEDLDSLSKHETPQWFDDAKYGIFVHWGPYAVPGWGGPPENETYAEWFWWYTTYHDGGRGDVADSYGYRLRTFGPEWNYDDSFTDFTGEFWDPKAWVDLFADAGAKYFVMTTKHHDGFALFDTGRTTNRSSLHYGPKRDIIKDLFDAAARYQPQLKRGTYFSLPEWFNPDMSPYAFTQTDLPNSVSWLGVEAKNPYTGRAETYTGRTPINDFITDLMVPQMEALAYGYNTDIMWCDDGAANGTPGFAANWWNWARLHAGRQVTMNNRCGVVEASDFETPEYTTYSSAQRRKWESNRGMDPFSYGYNRGTPDEAYMNARTIIFSLVDMVAKNGNFLLDVGPRADGTVPQVMQDNLREAGRWIQKHGEAIFNTTYWFVQTQITEPSVRFTQTDDAFYILFLEKPVAVRGTVLVDAPIPIIDGDELSLLGVPGVGMLKWAKQGPEEALVIEVPADALDRGEFCWVFKVKYAT
ncbi:Tissue alpha-L-fucosidase [Pleurostoma richardsiae]|uniref:alpha-L-fucosidase n=1 Tax=Pleurostoma richardsiae TaxID=41990 RepID=A0AA38R300_9PEZI|nr:Tissue alpha-L-fucosidase [Pleurostoma richardsiae]